MVNASRNLARTSSVYLAAAPEFVRLLLGWTAAFSRATMHHLRGRSDIGSQISELPPDEIKSVLSEGRLPLAISRQMTAVIATARERNVISDSQQQTLDLSMQALVDVFGACERIHDTPMPFGYALHLRRALILYCLTLPFALVGQFGWATVPAVLLIAYILMGIEQIGIEIEDPFGEQNNVLPLDDICNTIDADLRGVMGSLPAAAQQ
jgi:putative membrane protein